MGLLVAGTKYRGEFEERLKKLMDEIKQVRLSQSWGAAGMDAGRAASISSPGRPCWVSLAPTPSLPAAPAPPQNDDIILMIDEVHTLIGAGAAEGAIDAANILKPALARGELQVRCASALDNLALDTV